jgi:hypothetical protein
MPCACVTCRKNGETLGLREFPATRDAIHHAYRRAAMAWHPDRFASQPDRIREAEVRFKIASVAYQELATHNPEEADLPPVAEHHTAPEAPAPQTTPRHAPHSDWPHNLPGLFIAPHLPSPAQAVTARNLGSNDYPIAILDLSGDGNFHRFFLVASPGVILKDDLDTISLIHFEDMGKVELLDREKSGKIGFWEKVTEELLGTKHKLALEIYRRDGSLFCSLANQANDGVKPAIHRFLTQTQMRYNG